MTRWSGRIAPLPERCAGVGNRLTRWWCGFMLRLFRWEIRGDLPNEPRFLAVVAPHTTGWDFALGMFCIQAMGIKVWWMGADWMFRFPFVRALGGIPIDRGQRRGVVDQTIEQYKSREHLVIALAPEGSRKKKPWKSGFYHIAKGADIPMLLVGISHRERRVYLGPTLPVAEDLEATYAELSEFFGQFADEYPDNTVLPGQDVEADPSSEGGPPSTESSS